MKKKPVLPQRILQRIFWPRSFLRRPKLPEKNILDRAEEAIARNDHNELLEIATELATLTCSLTYLVEPTLVIADRLAQFPEFQLVADSSPNDYVSHMRLLGVYSHIFRNAPINGDVERRARNGFAKLSSIEEKVLGQKNPSRLGIEQPHDPSLPSARVARKFVSKHKVG